MRRTNFILGKCLELLSSMQRFIELTLVYGTGLSSYLSSSPESITTEGWSKGLCFNPFVIYKTMPLSSLEPSWPSSLPLLPGYSCLFFPQQFSAAGTSSTLSSWRIHLSGSCDSHNLIVFPETAAGWHLTIYRLMFRENLAPEFVAFFPLSSPWSQRFCSGQSQPLCFPEPCPLLLHLPRFPNHYPIQFLYLFILNSLPGKFQGYTVLFQSSFRGKKQNLILMNHGRCMNFKSSQP